MTDIFTVEQMEINRINGIFRIISQPEQWRCAGIIIGKAEAEKEKLLKVKSFTSPALSGNIFYLRGCETADDRNTFEVPLARKDIFLRTVGYLCLKSTQLRSEKLNSSVKAEPTQEKTSTKTASNEASMTFRGTRTGRWSGTKENKANEPKALVDPMILTCLNCGESYSALEEAFHSCWKRQSHTIVKEEPWKFQT